MTDVSKGSGDAARQFILASTVKGTPVFNGAGERIGDIDDVAIGKRDGKVVYAILSFGGFLGVGEKYFPVPWPALNYVTDQNGYVIALTQEQLRAAPSYSKAELADVGATDEGMWDTLGSYYGQFGVAAPW